VGLAAPFGWFDGPTSQWLASTLGGGDVHTSFFISHHLISQTLSVFALIAITLVVVRIVPEVVEPLEEVLYVITNTEVDLTAAVGNPQAAGTATGADVQTGSQADAAAGPGDVPGSPDEDVQPDGGSAGGEGDPGEGDPVDPRDPTASEDCSDAE
jgi:hypothetical protein